MSTGALLTDPASGFAARFPLFMRAALLSAWGIGTLIAGRVVVHLLGPGEVGGDARAYWLTGQRDELYGAAPGVDGAFLYSPAFAQLVRVFTALPWPGFVGLWICLEAVALWWLLRPLSRRWAAPVALACLPELVVGNIYLLLAVAVVLAMRYPAWWAFAVLTKVTPGVGVLWFVVRGEWRKVLVAAAATAGVVAVSFAVDPGAWVAWGEFLLSNQDGAEDGRGGLLLRCLVAVALVAVAARADHPWLIAAAMLFASPVGGNLPVLAVLAAMPRLVVMRRKYDRAPITAIERRAGCP